MNVIDADSLADHTLALVAIFAQLRRRFAENPNWAAGAAELNGMVAAVE